MARLPRYVIPGQPQHIIRRGNNRQVIFLARVGRNKRRALRRMGVDGTGIATSCRITLR